MFKINSPTSWLLAGTTTISALVLVALPLANLQAQSSRVKPAEILNAHNKYRTEVNIPGLTWSDEVAKSAQKWADNLAATNSFEHSGTNYGENIWQGTANAYTQTDMVDGWGSEKKDFKYGTFPDVSSTGDWSDVGHYTQIVWKNTKEVGCGLATSQDGNDILVCQYNPPGNYNNQKPY
ncbi:MAG TPA: hypothetical protein DEP38_14640 [Cyanobacteria bacterium UBA9226]|nr:hypothetical protein [Cyanobacteria bacterium UBA9226]